jgi:hypothetical protein
MSLPAPAWLTELEKKGYAPYIATSRKLLSSFDTAPFGKPIKTFLLDEPDDAPFLEAYLLSNSLGFESPNHKMPNWVFVDCVLLPCAVVGFTLPVEAVPENLLHYYREDKCIDFGKLTHIPITGQSGISNIDKKSLTGITLFSLGKHVGNVSKLAVYTRVLGFEVYRARACETYYGITQYDNVALKVHGRFGREMEISQPIVLTHPGKDNTFIYKMKLEYDPADPVKPHPDVKPTFWLDSRDKAKKQAMMEGIKRGKRYIIAPPFSVQKDGGVFLPIVEKDAR